MCSPIFRYTLSNFVFIQRPSINHSTLAAYLWCSKLDIFITNVVRCHQEANCQVSKDAGFEDNFDRQYTDATTIVYYIPLSNDRASELLHGRIDQTLPCFHVCVEHWPSLSWTATERIPHCLAVQWPVLALIYLVLYLALVMKYNCN